MLYFLKNQGKHKIRGLIICTFMIQIAIAQNLVLNGDFELYTTCPFTWSDFNATFWINPSAGTPDYFNQCAGSAIAGVPANGRGFQHPHSGAGYAGIMTYAQPPVISEYREYIETALPAPLQPGVSYDFQMYVSLADLSSFSTSDIGAHFSVGPISNMSNFTTLALTPQITNSVGLISDTSNWTLIAGRFIATGGEDHITIGNFKNDANTNYSPVTPSSTPHAPFSSYYIDDVSLQISPCQVNLEKDTTVCFGDTLILDVTTPNATYLWQDNSTNPTFTVTQSGTYWVQITDSCGTLSDTISVTYQPLLTLDLGNDTTVCQGDTLILDVTTLNATYLWQDNSTNPTFTVTQSGTYWVQITDSCGSIRDSITVNYQPFPTINLGNDTTLCLGTTLVLDATTPNATYLWQDNSTNRSYTVTQEGTFWVEVSIGNCSTIDTITIFEENCEVILEMPNVFTPNNDGINDLFVPVNSNKIAAMKTVIYNRWGSIVYETNNPLIEWNGQDVTDGVYFWIVHYTDTYGNENHLTGDLTLMR